MRTFELNSDAIDLCDLLKIMGCCATGGEAKIVIAEGLVTVNGQVETRKRCKIRTGSNVSYGGETISVR